MRSCYGNRHLRRTTRRVLTVIGCLALAACAVQSADDDISHYVKSPSEWQSIELTEADLTLPTVSPLRIASLSRRVNNGEAVEDLYLFHGSEGYVKTSRLIGDIYPESAVQSIRGGSASRDYIANLSLPATESIVVPAAWGFQNGKSRAGKFLSRGFAAQGSAPPRHDDCFVAHVAYLFVELEAAERSGDTFDTIVEVLLCGGLPRDTDLMQMMVQIDAVRDRAAFRAELARHDIDAD